MVAFMLGLAAVGLLFLPGGLTWLGLGAGIGATVTGIRGLSRYGAGWSNIVGLVLGAGVSFLLTAIFARIVWLNL